VRWVCSATHSAARGKLRQDDGEDRLEAVVDLLEGRCQRRALSAGRRSRILVLVVIIFVLVLVGPHLNRIADLLADELARSLRSSFVIEWLGRSWRRLCACLDLELRDPFLRREALALDDELYVRPVALLLELRVRRSGGSRFLTAFLEKG
jgi:hypothetical protein